MFASLDLNSTTFVFVASALCIAAAGIRLTRIVDTIADRTGLGEAMVGAIFLGAATSLSGVVTSVSAAWDGNVDLSFSNAAGGIAAQTAFLAIADIMYRRTNLEHAAASPVNLVQAALLILLLSLPLLAFTLPSWSVLGLHPVSLILFAVYAFGLQLSDRMRKSPMWVPKQTPETRIDRPEAQSASGPSNSSLTGQFIALAVLVSFAGWAIAGAGGRLSELTGLSNGVIGALFTAVATSLPELVTTLAAIRRGALQLAVGGIIGGNTFDVLFFALSDAAYRGGSLYHAISPGQMFWLALGIIMTAILLLGLLKRDRGGPAGIGFESSAVLALYMTAVCIQVTM